uniref:homocysteine S-methyltransferase family protein n=1 Tax=Cetobacterium sp. TaxID=2071632 RepID=UPI0025C37042
GLQSLNLVKERMKEKKLKKPLMISFAVNKDGKLYSGEKLVDIYENFIDDYIVSIGINCSELTEGVIEALKKIKKETNLKVSFHPNSDGNIKKFVKDINRLLKIKVVDIVGGCCGTDFDHIKMLKMSFEEKL